MKTSAAKRKRRKSKNPRLHVCCICDHRWESLDNSTAKKVRAAAKVNHDGPHCGMCRHFEMAERYALNRGFETVEGGLKKWLVMRDMRAKRKAYAKNPH